MPRVMTAEQDSMTKRCERCNAEIPRRGRRKSSYAKARYCSNRCAAWHRNRTDEAVKVIEANLYRRGATWCAKKLGKQRRTVLKLARQNSVMTPSTYTVAEVAYRSGFSWSHVRRAADSVLTTNGHATAIPEKWAEQFIAQHENLSDEAKYAGYYTRRSFCAYLGIHANYFYRGMRGEGEYAFLADIPYLRGKHGAMLYNPHHVERAYRTVRGLKRAA